MPFRVPERLETVSGNLVGHQRRPQTRRRQLRGLQLEGDRVIKLVEFHMHLVLRQLRVVSLTLSGKRLQ